MIEAGITAKLDADPGVSALVGAGVMPLTLPPGFTAFPAITYAVLPDKQVILLDGSMGELHSRLRFRCHALTYAAAANLRAAVHAALDTFAGPLADGTIVQAVEPSDGADFYIAESKVYGCICEFIFHFQ
jgi:hypothetical protein